MASTLTTESRSSLRDRRPAVPILLSSFPLPPSHIPSGSFHPSPSPSSNLSNSPLSPFPSAGNPPLSLPPAAPLPPVPGPSPVSHHETVLLMSAARSRRASKLSLNSLSSYSRRSSSASSTSASTSLPSLSPSVSITPGGDSTRSLRSSPSNGSLIAPSAWRSAMIGADKSPVLETKIYEEDPADLTRLSLDEIHDPEMSEDEKGLARIGASVVREHAHHHGANDSISSIDMRDLPQLTDREDDVVMSVTKALPSPKKKRSEKDLPPLPLDGPARPGAESPDIQQILATTPRPRRKSSGCVSRSSSPARARSKLRRYVSDGTALSSSQSRRTSDGHPPRGRQGMPAKCRLSEGEGSFVVEDSVLLDATGTPTDVLNAQEEERLDRALDGEGSDSDSDIDIRTPLPHLMLRDGLLSPNSKLLPQAQSVDDRPGSHLSLASVAGSVMTKSGLFRDDRDTVQRRVRHRDGKLLRGGIGLTTGLGWSDSEDEDAPSPLTRKLSSTSVGRKSLPASLRQVSSNGSSLSQHFDEMNLEEGRRPRASLPSDLSQKASASSMPRSSISSLRSMPSSSRLSTSRLHVGDMPKPPLSAPPTSSLAHTRALPAVRKLERTSSEADALYRSDPAPRKPSTSSRAGSMRSSLSRSTSSTTVVVPGSSPGPRSVPPPTAWAGVRGTEVPRPLMLPQGTGTAPDSMRRRSDGTDKFRLSSGSASSASGGSTRGREQTRVPSATLHVPASRAPSVGPDGKAPPRTGTGMVYRRSPNNGAPQRPTMMRTPSSTKLRAAYQKEIGITT